MCDSEKVVFDMSKLRGRIVEKYGSLSAFAEAVDSSLQTVSLKINGKTDFSRQDIIIWGDKLDIEPSFYDEYFFTHKV